MSKKGGLSIRTLYSNNVEEPPSPTTGKPSYGFFSTSEETIIETISTNTSSLYISEQDENVTDTNEQPSYVNNEEEIADTKPQPATEEDEKLEELLDSDDILSRCKETGDFLLSNYLNRDEILLQMIHFIIKEYVPPSPEIPPDIVEKYACKFPYIACEILTTSLGKVYLLPKILEDSSVWTNHLHSLRKPKSSQHEPSEKKNVHLLDELFSILDSDTVPLFSMKLFIRVVIALMKTSALTDKTMTYLFANQGKVLKQLVKHVYLTDDICEILLLSLVYEKEADSDSDTTSDYSDLSTENDSVNGSPEHKSKGTNGTASSEQTNGNASVSNNNWSVKENILTVLMNLLVNDDYCENVSAVVSTVLTLPRPSLLVEELLKKEKIVPLIDKLVQKATSTEVFSEGMDFLGTLMIHSQQGDESIQVLLESLHKFVVLLNQATDIPPIETTVGKIEPALGAYRLKIVEFFVIIFKHYKELSQVHNDIDIKTPLMKSGILQAIVKLFFEFENNNILHNLATHILTCVLENESSLSEMVEVLLNECKLVERLVEGYEKNKRVMRETRLALGYMGHLTIIENFLSNLETEKFREQIKLVSGWMQVSEELKEKHFIECIYRHGGNIPLPQNYVKTFVTDMNELEQQKSTSSSTQSTTASSPSPTSQEQEAPSSTTQ